jgi:hypothetical protein
MKQTKWFIRKLNFIIAVLILSMISIQCSSSSTATPIYEGPYWGKNSNDKAVVVGRVTDKDDNRPLTGATVIIVEAEFGGAVDENGNYEILRIPSGVYDIYAKNIGYKDAFLNDVKLDSNKLYIIDFELMPEEWVF